MRVAIGRFAEDSSDCLDRIKIRIQIILDENLPRGRIDYVGFNITNDGCGEPRLSLKE